MKRNPRFNGLVISVALSAVLTGCGSIDSAIDDIKNEIKTASIEGKAVDGYLQYATVCLDLSQDGYCQSSEPSTQTDEDGKFTLEVSAKIQAQENYEKAMLLVYGGKDVDTGVDFNGKLLAPKDGNVVNITPITTLVAKTVQKELKRNKYLSEEQIKEKIRESRKKVAQALDISEEDMGKDPVAEQRAGRDDLMMRGLQLQKAAEAMLLAGNSGDKAEHERAEEIYEAFVAGLDNMGKADRGITKLLDKTFQQASNDEQLRALLGGGDALNLGEAAKKVAENIEDRFENFDPKDDDFLEKIASTTKDDLQQIKIEYDNGSDDIAGQISIDINNPIFKAGFDWGAKFIKDDLHHLGLYNPSDELVKKIKRYLADEGKIKPGILFIKKEKLKDAEDEELQRLYKKIKIFEEQQKEKKEKEDAKNDDKIIKITPPMSLYFQEEAGYGQVTFNENQTMSFKKYKIEDGKFVQEQEGDKRVEFIYNGQSWQPINEDEEEFSIDSDGIVHLSQRNEEAYLAHERDISGWTKTMPRIGLDVSMPEGAKMSFITIKKTDDTYILHDEVENHHKESKEAYTSISEFIQRQCQTNWFMGDENGGLAFKGTINENGQYICDTSARSGKLVVASKDMFDSSSMMDFMPTSTRDAGTWEIKSVNGTDILIAKPYNVKKYNHDDEGLRYEIFSLKDGKLYRGDFEPKGTKHIIPSYNEIAINAIATEIIDNWEDFSDQLGQYKY